MSGAGTYEIKQSHQAEPYGVPTGVTVLMPTGSWETPGTVLCDRLAACDAVQAIYERLEPDRHALFVILTDDDEAVLDLVFETERELFKAFPRMPFDLRVMRPSETWDAEALRASSTAHYERV